MLFHQIMRVHWQELILRRISALLMRNDSVKFFVIEKFQLLKRFHSVKSSANNVDLSSIVISLALFDGDCADAHEFS